MGSGEGRGQGTSGILQGIFFIPLPILYFQIVSVFVNTVHSVFTEHLLGMLDEQHRAADQADVN